MPETHRERKNGLAEPLLECSETRSSNLETPEANRERKNGLAESVSVLLESVSVLLESVSVLLESVSVLLESVSVLLESVSVLLESVSVLLEGRSVLLEGRNAKSLTPPSLRAPYVLKGHKSTSVRRRSPEIVGNCTSAGRQSPGHTCSS
jgi:hypothetical protein